MGEFEWRPQNAGGNGTPRFLPEEPPELAIVECNGGRIHTRQRGMAWAYITWEVGEKPKTPAWSAPQARHLTRMCKLSHQCASATQAGGENRGNRGFIRGGLTHRGAMDEQAVHPRPAERRWSSSLSVISLILSFQASRLIEALYKLNGFNSAGIRSKALSAPARIPPCDTTATR